MSSLHRAFCCVALVASIAIFLEFPIPALAHSVLESSLPPPNASLESPPRDLLLRFSEPVDPSFSTVVVLAHDGRQVSGQTVFTRDNRQVTVPFVNLERGIYTVRWRVLSAVDGHTTTGFFAFAVGVPIAQTTETGTSGPPPAVAMFRWIGLLAAIAIAGIAFFQSNILQPSIAGSSAPDASRLALVSDRHLRVVTVIGGWILIASVTMEFILQGLILLDIPARMLLRSDSLWRLLTTTRSGWSILIQILMGLVFLLPWSPAGRILKVATLVWFLVVGVVATALGGPSAIASVHIALLLLVATVYGLFSVLMALILPQISDVRIPPFRWTESLAGGMLLAGITLASHAIGSGPIAVMADWVHLVAVAVWTGGLAALLVVLLVASPADRSLLAQILIVPFSTAAGISLGVIVLTGVYAAWMHVPSLQAFTVTLYGRTLLVKLVLVLALVTLGAFNRFLIRPRLHAAQIYEVQSLVTRFTRLIGSEFTLGAIVLLVVAVLTITPPARVSMPALAQEPLALAGVADDVVVHLTINPALPGWNRITIALRDARGQNVAVDGRILIRLTKLDEDLDRVTIPVTVRKGDAYVLEGGYIGLPGFWEVEVIIRRRGRPDSVSSFPLRVGQPTPGPLDQAGVRLFERARATMGQIRTWRQVDQIADGVGGFVVTRYEIVRPDRLHYRTSSGAEVVLIGIARYVREDPSPWRQDTEPYPLVLQGPYREYMERPGAIWRGRQLPCEEETCQVLFWDLPEVSATMIGWIGLGSGRVHRLLMVALAHYMTSWPSDFDQPITISPPR
jgi:copper transport protein